MALVTRTNRVSEVKGKPAPARRPTAVDIPYGELPTEKSEPIDNLNQYIGFMHGEPGIGKTSALMQEEDTLLLSFDRPEDLSIYQRYCPDWPSFEGYCNSLARDAAKGTLRFKRVLVDGVDIGYKHCQQTTETKLDIEDVSDAEYGKGFNQVNKRFGNTMALLYGLTHPDIGCGIWSISHSTESQIKQKDGTIKTFVKPYMSAGCGRMILGRAHFAFYYRRVRKQERVLMIRGSAEFFAKCNADYRFLTPKGEKIFEIPAGNSPAETWQYILDGFNNKLTRTHVQPAGGASALVRKPTQDGRNGGIPLRKR